MHVQLKLPAVFAQLALALQLLPPPGAHSLTSLQLTPSPLKPVLHAQLKLPAVLVQVAFALQLLPPPAAHSFTSLQVTPFPE